MNLKILVPCAFLFSCSTGNLIRTQNRPGAAPSTPNRPQTVVLNPKASPVKIQPSDAKIPTASPIPVEIQAPLPEPLPVISVKPNLPSRPVSNITYPTNYKRIGVVLPLTGKSASLGQRALSAIRIGFNINADGGSSEFALALYDTQSNPDLAAKAVEKLIREDQVIAIMGGLGAKEATALAERAEYFQIPLFTFSQKSSLTEDAQFTFRNSVTPGMQTSKIVDFAVQSLGMKKFALLYPNDAYGVEFANQFWDHVLAHGGTVVAAQTYDPKESDLTMYIQKMVGTYYPESRAEEFKSKLEEIAEREKNKKSPVLKKGRENVTKENILPPIVDFEALFIPDSSKAMGQAIAFLKNNDVNQMTYLGTNLWNTEDLVRRAGTDQHGANHFFFVDNVISYEQRQSSDFNKKFLALMQEEPSAIETQTYESARILHDVIMAGARDRVLVANRLKELGRKQGAFSEIFMNNSNEIVRDLSVMTLQNGVIKTQEL